VIEIVDEGEARTAFMRFGDRIRMTARDQEGRAPFGAIDQRVVPATIDISGEAQS
jgi:fumarylacetoacetate (FAA) hydrolase